MKEEFRETPKPPPVKIPNNPDGRSFQDMLETEGSGVVADMLFEHEKESEEEVEHMGPSTASPIE